MQYEEIYLEGLSHWLPRAFIAHPLSASAGAAAAHAGSAVLIKEMAAGAQKIAAIQCQILAD